VSPDRGLRRVATKRSLRIIDEALGTLQMQVTLPCDAVGAPTP